jgi:NitT/TauT family transport system ATP-binding protein
MPQVSAGVCLRVERLCKSYGREKIFKDISFSLSHGQSLALVGPSGCGKTTLLHVLAGLIDADAGDIDITPPLAPRSLVMQDHGLFPWKTAYKNLELPLVLAGHKKNKIKDKVNSMLQSLELTGLGHRFPSQLSGGQRQRLALGRSLMSSPKLILLDEPFSSLDAITRESQQGVLSKIWADLGITMILATHSIEEAVLLGQSILVLGGKPTSVKQTFANPHPAMEGARGMESAFRLANQVRSALANYGLRKEEQKC